MSVELLVSTMNKNDYELIKKMNIQSNAIIINQCDRTDRKEMKINGYNVIWIDVQERGLSRSRNMALKNSTADYCLICDDDEILADGYASIIEESFSKVNNADIIAFDFIKRGSQNRYTKIFEYGNSKKVSKAPYFKCYCSIRLAFRRKKIIANNLYFDERFGAGSGMILSGEETLWQVKAKRVGLKIFHVPYVIAELIQQESSWFDGFNNKYFYDLGACLSVNYPFLCHILKYYYVINIRGGKMSNYNKIKWLKNGIREFRQKGISYEQYIEDLKL